MALRPRQKELVFRAVEALRRYGDALAVAPTGAGKTVMLSAIIGEMAKGAPFGSPIKACILAHRDELTAQNEAKFRLLNPHLSTSVFNASCKSWEGDATFAMAQTLSRTDNLAAMPSFSLLAIDEAHHSCSESYLRIIARAKEMNPSLRILGMTATPNRGDKKGLRTVFSNVCDQITVNELVASGHLAPPRTFAIDVGVQQQLKRVKKTAGDYDREEVAQIMDTRLLNDAVFRHWKEMAGNRQTVVFCSTVNHARHVHKRFVEGNAAAVLIHGEMGKGERERALGAYATGQAQVIVNVAVLTEGWDHPPTSCVVLLRPSSHKSAMIQMIGRGLRPVNPEEHPGVIKTDCLVLDFGTATLMHGSLEQAALLEDGRKGETPYKACPNCNGQVPANVCDCPLCGVAFEGQGQADETEESEEATETTITEIDLLRQSPFLWEAVDGSRQAFMAPGFTAWGGVFFREGRWHAVGGLRNQLAKLLTVGNKSVCFAAANDWLSLHETDRSAHKVMGWGRLPATDKQLAYLPEHQDDGGLTRYRASALLSLKFNAQNIERALQGGACQ